MLMVCRLALYVIISPDIETSCGVSRGCEARSFFCGK